MIQVSWVRSGHSGLWFGKKTTTLYSYSFGVIAVLYGILAQSCQTVIDRQTDAQSKGLRMSWSARLKQIHCMCLWLVSIQIQCYMNRMLFFYFYVGAYVLGQVLASLAVRAGSSPVSIMALLAPPVWCRCLQPDSGLQTPAAGGAAPNPPHHQTRTPQEPEGATEKPFTHLLMLCLQC